MKLHVGCGNVILPGWANLDAMPGPRVDVVDDAQTLRSIPQGSVDLLYASHILDHFSRNDTDAVLRLWHSRLRPGGTLRLAVSDFAASVEQYRETGDLPALLGLLVGGHKDEFDRHGTAFDRQSLTDALLRTGFVNVDLWDWRKVDHAEHDDFSRAYLPHMDMSGRLMSLNLEAAATRTALPDPAFYAIGDSHVWVFTQAHGHPSLFEPNRAVHSLDGRFLVNRMGPWLAHGLQDNTRREAIYAEVDKVAKGTPIILSFGEIDGRCHIVPTALERGQSINDVALDTVRSYLVMAADIIMRGHPVYLWNAPPQTGGPCYNPDYPIRGTYAECRHAVECINGHLATGAVAIGAKFVSIYDRLVCGSRTQTSYFLDYIHLDPRRVWPFIEEALS